jgi:hypothetical protein
MKRIVLLSILFLFSANISAQNKKAERIAKKEAAYQEVKQLVENGNFTFNALWLITHRSNYKYLRI